MVVIVTKSINFVGSHRGLVSQRRAHFLITVLGTRTYKV